MPGDTDPGTVLDLHGVDAGYRNHRVLREIALSIRPGTTLGLIGPNGSGKSTLLRVLCRLLDTTAGTVILDGHDISRLSTIEVAKRMAVLTQSPDPPSGITVRELVEQGRFPHRGLFGRTTQQDRRAVAEALTLTSMDGLEDCHVDELSGGERQRAWIALTIAQQTSTLLLDEPTTFLDMGHQLEVLDLIDRLRIQRGLTVVMVLHDLNQAARHCERIIVLSGGRTVADGPPSEIITTELVRDHFGAHAIIGTDPTTGSVVVIPQSPAPRLGARDHILESR